ncbi:hypothetical protein [Zunongwangia sp.]|uniref:hypothetical protein n=1 Tax=Zunongwangia sp. TaxID=1965325 RepID=UPI003AA88751
MRYFFLVLISCSLCFSCKKEQQKAPKKDIRETKAYTASYQAKKATIALSDKAKVHALKWAEYITAKNEIDKLSKTSVNSVIENAESIAQIMEALAVSVPDSLQTKSVIARLTVLNTKAQVLEQKANNEIPNAEQIKKVSIELPEEFNNLNIQINEIFLQTIKDFEEKLDKLHEERLQELREKDSLDDAKPVK